MKKGNKFEIGDIVEGTHDGRWVLGKIAHVDSDGRLGIDVQQSTPKGRARGGYLHNLNGCLTEFNGWYIPKENAKFAKNQIVINILNDL